MAIQRLNFKNPINFQGLETILPESGEPLKTSDVQPFIMELVRRLAVDRESLKNDLYAQVVSDPSVLPAATDGASTPTTTALASQNDVDLAELEGILWG